MGRPNLRTDEYLDHQGHAKHGKRGEPGRQAEDQQRRGDHFKRPRPANGRRSRPRRWHDAVAELLALQSEYAAWLDTLPDTLPDTLHDTLHDTALAAGLQAIVDLDLDMLAATEPPRGYRRD